MSTGERPPHVDPQLLFGISLLAGLALSAQALNGAMHGDVDITVAGLRLLVAIAFSWAAIYGITAMFASFSAHVDQAARDTAERPDTPRRRATDLAGGVAPTAIDVPSTATNAPNPIDAALPTPPALATGLAALGAANNEASAA